MNRRLIALNLALLVILGVVTLAGAQPGTPSSSRPRATSNSGSPIKSSSESRRLTLTKASAGTRKVQAKASRCCSPPTSCAANHEDSAWFTFAEALKQSGKELHMLDGKAFAYGPLVIVGFPCLMAHGDVRGHETRALLEV